MVYDDDEELFPRKRGLFTFQDGLIIIASITVGAIIVYFLLKWLEQGIRFPAPNYSMPPTPYWSPYPYSPYMPQAPPVQPTCTCGKAEPTAQSHWAQLTTNNHESWQVHRDKRGNISSVDVHRNVREF